ncbi:MAG: AMP-binding protein [Acidimicrobiales bacterium]|nr:AMP-binding protein [Acidimicrobiales bacterium]
MNRDWLTARGAVLAHWAEQQPDEAAIISPSGNRTFAELEANINRLAHGLRALGMRAGDSLAVVCTNRVEYAEIVFACVRAGVRYTPINWHLVADEIAYIVNDCEARAVIGDAHIAGTLAVVPARAPAVDIAIAVGGPIEGYEDYDAVIADESEDLIDDPQPGSRMLYTSGTTGRPKGVVRPPNYSTGLEALTTAPGYGAGLGQRHLCTGPLYHGGPHGLSLTVPLSSGVGVVMMDRWDAATALELIERYRVTHTHMVPTMFHRLLRLPAEVREQADVSSLEFVLHGAAPCPVETKFAVIDWFGPVVWEYFAATEGSGSSCNSEDWLARPGTVGRPPHPDHVRILDDEGHTCPPGEVGEICFRHDDTATFSYFKDDAKTAASKRGDGYASVGDIGYIDDDGWLFVTDRNAELILRGGVNIYPAEIEAALLAHPAVRDAGVIGVPDSEWGESVAAVVELDDLAGEDALIEWCHERLAAFKCPTTVHVTEALPRLDNGKLYRHQLRDQYRP